MSAAVRSVFLRASKLLDNVVVGMILAVRDNPALL
jgi:hypothetical protein